MKKQGFFTQLCPLEDPPALIELIFLKKKSSSEDLLKRAFLRETNGGHPENVRGIMGPETTIWVFLGYNVFSSQNLEFSVIFAF